MSAIPFPITPTVLNAGEVEQVDFLYFEFPIDIVNRPDAVFTDASANTTVPPNFYSDASDLEKLDWMAIDSLKWKDPSDDVRHRRMAELLVHGTLPLKEASFCVVCNEKKKLEVESLLSKTGADFPKITFEHHGRYHWYKQNIDGNWTNYSLKKK